MAIRIATGTQVAIASTYGTPSNMTALTNAAEAVATLAAGHGVVVGDILEITSGWGLLNGRLARAKTVATNDVTLEGINTTDVNKYPAGTGTGTVRRITAWQPITQIAAPSSAGGEQQFADSSTLDDVDDKQIPSSRSAETLTLEVHDDPALPWYSVVQAAQDAGAPVGLRMVFPGASRLLANAYWSVRNTPSVTRNETLKSQVSVAYSARPTRYAT